MSIVYGFGQKRKSLICYYANNNDSLAVINLSLDTVVSCISCYYCNLCYYFMPIFF